MPPSLPPTAAAPTAPRLRRSRRGNETPPPAVAIRRLRRERDIWRGWGGVATILALAMGLACWITSQPIPCAPTPSESIAR